MRIFAFPKTLFHLHSFISDKFRLLSGSIRTFSCFKFFSCHPRLNYLQQENTIYFFFSALCFRFNLRRRTLFFWFWQIFLSFARHRVARRRRSTPRWSAAYENEKFVIHAAFSHSSTSFSLHFSHHTLYLTSKYYESLTILTKLCLKHSNFFDFS